MASGALGANLSKFLKEVEKACAEALDGPIYDEIVKTEAKNVKSVVYDSYEPTNYDRRYDMYDPNNIVGERSGLELVVTNITPANENLGFNPETGGYFVYDSYVKGNASSKDLANVVETGSGYDYFSPGPRPFTEATRQELEVNHTVETILMHTLKSKGFKVV